MLDKSHRRWYVLFSSANKNLKQLYYLIFYCIQKIPFSRCDDSNQERKDRIILESESLLHDPLHSENYFVQKIYSWICVLPVLCGYVFALALLGTLRFDDGDGNGSATKAMGLISKTTILHVHHAFLYITFPSLHDYDVKMPNSTMYRGSTQAKPKFLLSFWTWIWFLGIQL